MGIEILKEERTKKVKPELSDSSVIEHITDITFEIYKKHFGESIETIDDVIYERRKTLERKKELLEKSQSLMINFKERLDNIEELIRERKSDILEKLGE